MNTDKQEEANDERLEVTNEILSVLQHPVFWPHFNYEWEAEVLVCATKVLVYGKVSNVVSAE